jgi:hypothetical protein
MRVFLDKTPVMQIHTYFTPPLYAVIQIAVHNLEIIDGGKGEPGVNTT